MISKKNNLLFFFLVLTSAALLSSCGVYSFTGTSLPPDVKTFSIGNFPNNSGEGPATLSQHVTENFRNYFLKNTNLNMVPRDGDLQLEGQILSYSISPAAIQNQGDQSFAAANRLTIQMRITYVNTKDPKQNFEQTFSGFDDYPQNVDITQVDAALINRISERIIFEVFNKTVANW
jgi:hypothetical protein